MSQDSRGKKSRAFEIAIFSKENTEKFEATVSRDSVASFLKYINHGDGSIASLLHDNNRKAEAFPCGGNDNF